MPTISFKLYLYFVLVAFANALRDGAPPAACDSMAPSHESHVAQNSINSPFFLSVDFVDMNLYEVTLSTTTNGPQFRGILLQARLGTDGDSALGSWESPEGDLFKLADCHSNPSGALTHASNVDKTMPFTFVWQAPESISDAIYTIYATVVQEFSTFYVRIPSRPIFALPSNIPEFTTSFNTPSTVQIEEETSPSMAVERRENTQTTSDPEEVTRPFVEPEESTEPSMPIEPEESTEPSIPIEPEESTEPSMPIEPEEGTEPFIPVEPEENTQPPVEPEEITNPDEREETITVNTPPETEEETATENAEREAEATTQASNESENESTLDGGNSSQILAFSYSLGLASLLISIVHGIGRFY